MTDLTAFREEVRDWLEENCPASMRTPMLEPETPWGGRDQSYMSPDAQLWLERMGAKGWTAPSWPKEYGGGGLSKDEIKVLHQEMGRIKTRPALISFGLMMLGPVLLEYGNEEQKQEHLPKIARGEIRWCQGYSEPGAGSDLAGLQTRAIPDGDDYVINGQKIWTSYANFADWIFCLVRTDTSVKHEGISFILFDMTTDGVSTKPIKLISGESPFCETFFDDVRVPKSQMVGRLNGGWEIAKRLLQHERNSISSGGFGQGRVGTMEDLAKEYCGEVDGQVADPIIRERITKQKMHDQAFGLTVRRIMAEAKSGVGPDAGTSILKYLAAESNKARTELLIEIMGQQGLGWEGDQFQTKEKTLTRGWLRAKANSIEGGTTEINLNVVAKRVLGLRDSQ